MEIRDEYDAKRSKHQKVGREYTDRVKTDKQIAGRVKLAGME